MSDLQTTIPYGDSELTLDFDTGAKKADGSVVVSMNGTSVLITATLDSESLDESIEFVPLRVDYIERFYAIHQILGPRYTRREGKPSDEAVLTARLIDRSIRPHLPTTLRHSLHIVATVLSLGSADPDTLSIIGASAALQQTGINWSGPIAATKVEVSTSDDLHVNQKAHSFKARMLVAGVRDNANMVDFSGAELSEEMVSQVFIKAVEANSAVIKALPESNTANKKVANINESLSAAKSTENEIAKKLSTGWRSDGRGSKEVRELNARAVAVAGTHGSARFSRGDTAALSVVTLDSLNNSLMNESIETVASNSVDTTSIVHYNFPPYASGTAGRIGSPSRREVGHGYLTRKALLPTLPSTAEYPYTIRVVSEILSSDGSSSMASISAASLAMHTAGIPITNLCAGVAIGLAGSNEEPVILADISAEEDHNGLMDFKVAGTKVGITALQLDTKHQGINLKIFNDSLSTAKAARLEIIDAMQSSVAGNTYQHPDNAPLVVEVPREHIGRIIGKGGSNIREIEEKTGAKVSIENDRYAIIEGNNDAKRQVLSLINAETREYHVGEDFKAVVREFLPYGAIVELDAGREALLHVSELRDAFVEKTEDLLNVGDEVPVTIVETSSDGRIKVSIREKHQNFFDDKTAEIKNS